MLAPIFETLGLTLFLAKRAACNCTLATPSTSNSERNYHIFPGHCLQQQSVPHAALSCVEELPLSRR